MNGEIADTTEIAVPADGAVLEIARAFIQNRPARKLIVGTSSESRNLPMQTRWRISSHNKAFAEGLIFGGIIGASLMALFWIFIGSGR
jgi:hypothetical protein